MGILRGSTEENRFIDVTGVRGDLTERSHKIRSRILQWVGIPCGIGIGATKTLANHIAKTAERKPGSYPVHLSQVANLAEMTISELEVVLARAIAPKLIAKVHAAKPKLRKL